MIRRSNSDVCVITLNYFGSAHTRRCIESLRGQRINRTVVADNSCDDDARKRLERTLGECNCDFPIRLLVNEANLGFAAGMNSALSWLESNTPHDYYLLLNNDTTAKYGMVDALLAHMKAHPKTALVGPAVRNGLEIIHGAWYQRATGLHYSKRPAVGGFQYLSGCCMLIRRSLVRFPLFDEDFFMYGEDIELCWRLSQQGCSFAVVPNAKIEHKGTGSSRQGGFFYEFHTVRWHKLLARKMADNRWQAACFIAVRWVTLVMRGCMRSVRFRSLTPLHALVAAMLGSSRVVRPEARIS